MKTLIEKLAERFTASLTKLGYLEILPKMPLIVTSQQIEMADYQSNIAMGLAKKVGKPPREVAQEVIDNLDIADIAQSIKIAGPGFINLRLKNECLTNQITAMAKDSRFTIAKANPRQKIIIDFSGPNLAKEMHVGHLRSTIIGDSIARFCEFLGHEVLRVNHVGDWGTQFGMLVEYIRQVQPESLENPQNFSIDSLENFYRQAKIKYDQDETFAKQARRAVVNLQLGDEKTLAIWQIFCQESLAHCTDIYKQLNISIESRGESFYNDRLAPLVKNLLDCGLAEKTQGAIGIFLEGYENSKGEKTPVIIQKSDGGFIYATTDLAALQYRFQDLKVDRAIYVTDARQKTHFKQVFSIANKMNWIKEEQCQHIGFGMMLDGKGLPFKTRDGGTIKLKGLIEEAQEQAYNLAKELSPNLAEEELQKIAIATGIGGIKYADLVHGISTNYKFSLDKMLARDGNTASYLLISYARTRSLSRRLDKNYEDFLGKVDVKFCSSQERQFILKLVALPDIWQQINNDLSPNILLNYLYELSRLFSGFWNFCPVENCEDKQLQESRLMLCGLFGSILQWGLDLVGINTLEKI